MTRRESMRGKRIRCTEAVIARRLRFIKQVDRGYYEHLVKKPHQLYKRAPLDCGRSKCQVCHFEKVFGIEKKKYKGKGCNVTLPRHL